MKLVEAKTSLCCVFTYSYDNYVEMKRHKEEMADKGWTLVSSRATEEETVATFRKENACICGTCKYYSKNLVYDPKQDPGRCMINLKDLTDVKETDTCELYISRGRAAGSS